MNEKTLFVDDDTNLLASYQRSLRRQFLVETASSGESGLAKAAQEGPLAVVVADRQMPGMDAVEFLSRVRQLAVRLAQCFVLKILAWCTTAGTGAI